METPILLLHQTQQDLPTSFPSAPRDDNDANIPSFFASLSSPIEDPPQLIRDIANSSVEVKSSFVLPECDQRFTGSEPFAYDVNAKEFSRKFEDSIVQFQENVESKEILRSFCHENNDLLGDLVSASFVCDMNSQDVSRKAEHSDVMFQDNKVSVSFDEDNRGKIERTVKDLKSEIGFSKVQEFERNAVLKELKVDRNPVMVEKKETLIESKKKKSLAKIDVCSIFKDKHGLQNSMDCDANMGILMGLKGIDKTVKGSLKMEVIDDTVLVGTVPTDNGAAKIAERCVKKILKQDEADLKKPKWARKNAKNVNNGKARNDRQSKVTGISSDLKRKIQMRKYSKEEMMAMRFANVFQQRKLWDVVYNGLENGAAKEYDELATPPIHHQHFQKKKKKNVDSNYDHQNRFGKKENAPGILGTFDPRGR